MTDESMAVQAPETRDDAPEPQQPLSLKSLDHRLSEMEDHAYRRLHTIELVLGDLARMLVYHAEYALWSEGRDRFSGPRPHDKLRELRRQCDDMRKTIANGFTTNDRPDTDGAG